MLGLKLIWLLPSTQMDGHLPFRTYAANTMRPSHEPVVHPAYWNNAVVRHIRHVSVAVEIASLVDCRVLGECAHFRLMAFINRCMIDADTLLEGITPNKDITPNKCVGTIAPCSIRPQAAAMPVRSIFARIIYGLV